ncbi:MULTISPECIES: HAD family hydrolase [Methanoculleus]|uniref:HAD-superfamily hydrolase, subfamily IA, variant 1 n=2 Tax=Methanoculleus TaxID=45989 RepID=A3CVX0_METMJ|nr:MULTISPECIES: HAD-IA family hydrolase [Methanoculleus]ABN57520.1 HAD-superfamily hydrolase, subfamily IA, variant 1 [Methanoculleus marisnigri JR1]UYU18924.1 HAD-IA family hydrolase [Methanoculleus submarinus]
MSSNCLTTLILDFDGVVVESLPLKTAAFKKIFSFAPPKHLDEIIAFHLENGGMSRYDKFRHIYANILHEELTPEQEERLAGEYVGLIFESMLTVPYVRGAEELLRDCSRRLPLYIVSATPEGEMQEIVRRRDLTKYFVRIYGSPKTKAECIREILAETGASPEEALFVGDAPNDWQAAYETGVRFVARIPPGDPNRFAGRPGVEGIVENLHELREYLRGNICSSRSRTL